MTPVAVVVLAKEPVAGRVKTRLCPPCSGEEAAQLASAALADTLHSVALAAAPAGRRVLALAGEPGHWVPPRFEVIAQRGAGLDERLAAAFDDVGGPALLIGMDTPQVTAAVLTGAATALVSTDTDAVLGLADDGGWWAIGLRRPDPRVFLGVPMSEPRTGTAQLERLDSFGLRTRTLPRLRDVDDFDAATAVARAAPGTRFAAAVDRLSIGARA